MLPREHVCTYMKASESSSLLGVVSFISSKARSLDPWRTFQQIACHMLHSMFSRLNIYRCTCWKIPLRCDVKMLLEHNVSNTGNPVTEKVEAKWHSGVLKKK